MQKIELTILMPCLNEEETVGQCIDKAQKFLKDNKIIGEILIVDNGSTDNSQKIINKRKVRYIIENQKGYGSALITGINNAKGKYIIMGDADCSYDFYNIMAFVENLRAGDDLVMGNRFALPMEKGAMSFSHKYIGNPFLSFIGRKMFKISINDFHCGLRGFNTQKIKKINLTCKGMDFASEMIIKAQINNLKISEIPIKLYKDKRVKTKSHLRTVHDGILHLKTMHVLYKNNL